MLETSDVFGSCDSISGATLAGALGLEEILVRKDLALLGVPGRPRIGYPKDAIVRALRNRLGWDNSTDAALVGTGSLGRALLGYKGFREQNLSIAVAFDSSPANIGMRIGRISIQSADKITKIVSRLKLRMGILTVPDEAAQDCADKLVAGGVKGIWNFTSAHLAVPDGVLVQNVDLASSLAVLSHALRNMMEGAEQ